MKATIIMLTLALALGTTWYACAENERGPRGGSMNKMMQRIPIYKALDQDGNGELGGDEIKNASTSLLTLDVDQDGVLSQSEIMPKFPAGFGPGRKP